MDEGLRGEQDAPIEGDEGTGGPGERLEAFLEEAGDAWERARDTTGPFKLPNT